MTAEEERDALRARMREIAGSPSHLAGVDLASHLRHRARAVLVEIAERKIAEAARVKASEDEGRKIEASLKRIDAYWRQVTQDPHPCFGCGVQIPGNTSLCDPCEQALLDGDAA